MWTFLTILATVALIASSWWWRRRIQDLEARLATERQRTAALVEQHQQSLALEQAQRATLFNSMIEGVLLLDARGRVELVNQALEQLFGLRQNVRGQSILEAFHLHNLQALVNQVTVEGQVQSAELVLPGLDQRCLQINAASLLDRDGRPGGMILVFHDQTRIKQLENTRREFVANVSHELRTPLSVIKGYVETLIDGARDNPAVTLRFLQKIDKHAAQLTYLIEDLLAVSRLESGQVVMNLAMVEVHSIVDRVADDLNAPAASRQIRIENIVAADLSAHADPDRLQQVLFNLVDNAIKYGRPGGIVRIDGHPRDEQFIEMSVQDDGPGIPPEAVERVFERFYRVDRARSREQGGTGLGLAIVKHIIQAHGGEVWVKSELGQGATFFFTLPCT